MDQVLAHVASEMGVDYQPDRAEALEEIRFLLWKGHSEWEYSDSYGAQFADDVGLIRFQDEQASHPGKKADYKASRQHKPFHPGRT